MLISGTQTTRTILITILSFLFYYYLNGFFADIFKVLEQLIHFHLLSYFITYVIIGLPILIGTMVIHRKIEILSHLGLNKGFLKGILIAFIFALPMLAGGLAFFPLNEEKTIERLIKATLFAGFFEELYFRGFLFGQVFRYTKAGFIPSIIIGAILFASAHLYQSNEVSTLVGIFLATFMGSVFFAWLFVEWQFNLWVAIFLHAFMNLAWEIVVVSDNALGDFRGNIFRGLTIALAITGTIIYKKRKGMMMEINKRTLLWKN